MFPLHWCLPEWTKIFLRIFFWSHWIPFVFLSLTHLLSWLQWKHARRYNSSWTKHSELLDKLNFQQHGWINHCHCGTIADIKPLRFQRKVFHHWKQRENTFRKQSRTKNGDFSLPWSPHQGYDDQKRVPTLIKPTQQVKFTVFSK